jgi:hypothetical protein
MFTNETFVGSTTFGGVPAYKWSANFKIMLMNVTPDLTVARDTMPPLYQEMNGPGGLIGSNSVTFANFRVLDAAFDPRIFKLPCSP